MPLEAVTIPPELAGARVGLLVSGGVAAYKVVDLASSLVQAGCQVRVAMTQAATRFVGPATFHGVTGRRPQVDLWSGTGTPEPHVQLGDWAQVILVAPATANLLAKAAQGRSDDLVSATLLAARCPVVVAPAMNDAMWSKAAVQDNLGRVRELGYGVVEPEAGHLASGHTGTGRLASGQRLVDGLAAALRARFDLAGRRVVVSAGGTREPIDPVRFISNYSSGKMGFALAVAAAERGARVTLVSSAQHPAHAGVELVAVETAADMLAALREAQKSADLLIMAAAIADFRPVAVAGEKLHREERSELTLSLEKVPDLLVELGRAAGERPPYRVAFAAEGEGLERRALEKMARKSVDAIVANDIRRADIAFGSEDNEATVYFRDGSRVSLAKMPKREMADRLLDLVRERLP